VLVFTGMMLIFLTESCHVEYMLEGDAKGLGCGHTKSDKTRQIQCD